CPLAARLGRGLDFSSTADAVPAPGQGLYSALKRAADGIFHSLGAELASCGVSTVSLRLGLTQAGRGAAFLEHHPNLPWVSAEDAVSCMVFLLSDQGLCIRLTSITMDAGLLARKYSS
ncbi:MAG TPA: short-chain dehydrogenase, partial [Desulfomicrobiaceae bacterium]|nr:short-chain dehydrogenase [Desulfomicrobiaceae bacterium]